MHAEIADRMDEIASVRRRCRVSRLEVFGSAARGTDFDSKKSDADFLVEFQPPLLPGISDRRHGLHEDLRAAPGRKVDLIGTGAIRNRYLKEAIDSEREPVYASQMPGVGSRAPCIEETGK